MLSKNLVSVFIPMCLTAAISFTLNFNSGLYNNLWFYSIIYFAIFCFGFNLIYEAKKNNPDFTGILIVGIVVKLLMAFVIVFLCSILAHAIFFAFSIHFIIQYVLFTIFEIRYLLYLIKYNKSHENAP